jgi:hypothetical protein
MARKIPEVRRDMLVLADELAPDHAVRLRAVPCVLIRRRTAGMLGKDGC